MKHAYPNCGYWADLVPAECTCGAITDADLLRAQLTGAPLPEPKAHAQFKRRPPRPAPSASA